uniref:Uncharacterized protein n=1 Tax=Oryza glaberrima TaxID=4538 RepID=I1PD26_ORYGL
MAWTWRPEDLFLETLKDSLAQQRAWRHRGIAWRWPGARGQSGRGVATGRGGTTWRLDDDIARDYPTTPPVHNTAWVHSKV